MKTRCILIAGMAMFMFLFVYSCGRSRAPVPVRSAPPSPRVPDEKAPAPPVDKPVVEEQQPARRPVSKPPPVTKAKRQTPDDWLRELQAKVPIIKAQTGLNWSFDWDHGGFDQLMPSVKIEMQGATKRQASELADTIASSYLAAFPDAKWIRVSVYDWDSLEQTYWELYKRK